ncbi:MAG: condensation domain-containing protein, partial [Stackebrandtia sp.]
PRLPLTATGKLDRAAVRRLLAADVADPPTVREPAASPTSPDAAPPAADDAAPARVTTPLAELLLEEARALLGRPDLTLEHNFFDAGGHSILAFQLILRVGGALGVELELQPLFEAADLAHWAKRVEIALAQPQGAQRPPVCSVPPSLRRPSVGQVEILAAERYAGDSAAYTSVWCEHIRGDFDVDRFAAALRASARRHETLRTRYQMGAGGATLVVDDDVVIQEERRTLPDAGVDEAVRVAEQACARPYRLDREQPVRLHVAHLPQHGRLVTVMVHHVACDAVSFQVLLDETWRRYEGKETADPPAAPYRDFAAWQAEFVAGPAADEQRQWWRAQLSGLSPLQVRTDLAHADVRPRSGRRMPFRLDDALAEAVERQCRELRISPFTVLSAAYAVALDPYATATGHVVGVPCTARGLPEFDHTVGYFVNTLPLRMRAPDDGTVREWLRDWGAECVRTFAHCDLPLPEISRVWDTAQRRGTRLSALFAVNYVGPQPDGDRSRVRLDPGPVKFDVLLTLDRAGRRWSGELVHDVGALDEEDAADVLARFTEAARRITAELDTDVQNLVRRTAPAAVAAAEFDL